VSSDVGDAHFTRRHLICELRDKIEVRSHRVGEFDREAVILAEEPDGGPPYRVRWEDDGHECVFFPGRMRSLSTTRSDDRDTERVPCPYHWGSGQEWLRRLCPSRPSDGPKARSRSRELR